MTLYITIEETEHSYRLDKALSLKCPDISRSRIKSLILGGKVLLKGHPIVDPNFRVTSGDIFELVDPFIAEEAIPQAENIQLDIVYEDPHLIVINKPAGLVAHPAPGNYTGTLVNALIHHCGDELSGIGGVKRPGIVHRLDKETSGLMVVAKTDLAHQGLAAQFKDRTLSRTYWAFVLGAPIPPIGTIEKNIGRSLKSRVKMAVLPNGGRPAITHYKTIKRFEKDFSMAALVECTLETGRTHQIRVHLASIGTPIIGDILYGKTHRHHPIMQRVLSETNWPQDRHALHAKKLQFLHPALQTEMTFEVDLPTDLQRLAKVLE